MNGHQEGDPVKLAQALVTIAGMEHPPSRFIALAGASTASAESGSA
jgi:hypothetical protein